MFRDFRLDLSLYQSLLKNRVSHVVASVVELVSFLFYVFLFISLFKFSAVLILLSIWLLFFILRMYFSVTYLEGFLLLKVAISLLTFFAEWDLKFTFSILILALATSPLSYLILIIISERVFLPHVESFRYRDYRDYERKVFEFENPKYRSSKPKVLLLYPKYHDNLLVYEVIIKKIATYGLLFFLSRKNHRQWIDLLSYKNFSFILSSFILFASACLSVNYLTSHSEVFKSILTCVFEVFGELRRANLLREVCLLSFIVWSFFIIRLIVFFIPENIYRTLVESLPSFQFIYTAFSFHYLLPYHGNSEEYVPPSEVTFEDERRYLKEVIFALLITAILQFILTFGFLKNEEGGEGGNTKATGETSAVLYPIGSIKRTFKYS